MRSVSPAHAKKPRVIIADDHELFRNVLTLTLEDAGINIIEVVSSGQQAVDSTIKLKPDILILDVVMPDLDGLAALAIIKYLIPETKVIVITSATKPECMSRAGELGANAFFSKGVTSEMLISTIHSLVADEPSIFEIEDIKEPEAPTVPRNCLTNRVSKFSNEHNLTEQEMIVLSLMSMGFNNKTILDQLCISNNTLKSHTRNLYSKLGVNDRTQAVIWGLKNGFGESFQF